MISLLVPSRGRPGQLAGMWESAYTTATNPGQVELVVYRDDDDPTDLPDLGDATVIIGPRIVLSEMWNRCAEQATGDILWHGNDDVVFRSGGWDTAVEDAFAAVEDRIVLVHGRDGVQDEAIGTLSFLHRRWMNTVGYFLPPYFSSDWNDMWINDVAVELGRRVFLPYVWTDHMHPLTGKGEWDQTHQDRLERGARDNVGQLYVDLAPQRAEDVRKLREAMR